MTLEKAFCPCFSVYLDRPTWGVFVQFSESATRVKHAPLKKKNKEKYALLIDKYMYISGLSILTVAPNLCLLFK